MTKKFPDILSSFSNYRVNSVQPQRRAEIVEKEELEMQKEEWTRQTPNCQVNPRIKAECTITYFLILLLHLAEKVVGIGIFF